MAPPTASPPASALPAGRPPDVGALTALGERIVRAACARGATDAECVLRAGWELAATVRMGETESLKEAEGKSLGIRVFCGQQAASTWSSDLSWPAVERMIAAALETAQAASPDPFAGLPESSELGQYTGALGLHVPLAGLIAPRTAIELAQRAERAALDTDPRLSNSDGASFSATDSTRVLVNSRGFAGHYRTSACSLSVVPIGVENGAMQRDYWFANARSLERLDEPENVGRIAAERTLRRLGARKIGTARVPVVFEAPMAATLLESLFQAVNGEAIYREASFLCGQLGQQIASADVTVVDDGLRPGGWGTSPFDAEGVASRRTRVIAGGRLESYLLNCYAARKLGLKTTANAARALAGMPGVGCGNLYLQPGHPGPAEIIRSVPRGLFVTEFIGFGVNPVTGDYSRGASGLWIENGQLSYPVEEITVAGNLRDMFQQIAAIGNDLDFRTSIAAPTLLIEGLTVGGN